MRHFFFFSVLAKNNKACTSYQRLWSQVQRNNIPPAKEHSAAILGFRGYFITPKKAFKQDTRWQNQLDTLLNASFNLEDQTLPNMHTNKA